MAGKDRTRRPKSWNDPPGKLLLTSDGAESGFPSQADLEGRRHLALLAAFLGLLLATPLMAVFIVLVRTLYVEDVLEGGAAAR